MAIHKTTDGNYTISASQVWRPGVFESEKAARMGQRLDDLALVHLQGVANNRFGVITEAMICDYRESRRKAKE